ncbi:conserved hypothetical protein [Culex quinquefasciatus]|uniref:Uncharacterized protein n=1 Tax=Culex quinquefasciatus TaxID=7176 RepID=B0XF55_CULQU|nr:conserved hypothetical protein [Culex quinquefasciatus]|eukprot:XP_001868277.1 conserved hypothetical protein [Culex quinquefasciatus]
MDKEVAKELSPVKPAELFLRREAVIEEQQQIIQWNLLPRLQRSLEFGTFRLAKDFGRFPCRCHELDYKLEELSAGYVGLSFPLTTISDGRGRQGQLIRQRACSSGSQFQLKTKPKTCPTRNRNLSRNPSQRNNPQVRHLPKRRRQPTTPSSVPHLEASTAVEVPETPCAKKEAYQCTEKEEEKKEVTPKEVPAAEPEKASAKEEDEQMEVHSAAAAPSQSKSDGDATEGMSTSCEKLIKTLAKKGDAAEKEENEEEEEYSAIVADNSTAVDEKEAVASTSAAIAAKPEPKKDAPETSKESAASSVKEESSLKSSESSEVDSCTASSTQNTAEETNLYASNARKNSTESPPPSTTTTTTAANKLDLTQALTSEDALYEVSVWFDGMELQFLSVEKRGKSWPFQLPSARLAADSHSSATDSSETISSQSKAPPFKFKHTVRGAKALASLMIEEFTTIKRALSKDDEVVEKRSEPAQSPKSKQASSKSAKKQKPDTPVSAEPGPPVNQDDWLCCMARWTDRKYYAGKDVIVIGEKDTLLIVGHAEAGFVDEVKRNETTNEVSYVVRIGEGTVEVTGSDLYLNEEQAKYINWTCKAAEGGADDPMQSLAPGQTSSPSPAANAPISNLAHILPTTSTGYALVLPAVVCVLSSQPVFRQLVRVPEGHPLTALVSARPSSGPRSEESSYR